MVSLKSPLLTLTGASCCVCLLSDFLGLTCVHQSGMTALMWAVKGNCSRSVGLLLDGGANTEIRDKVSNVMSCHAMSCHAMPCHVIG
jgi:Ankyrin repeat